MIFVFNIKFSRLDEVGAYILHLPASRINETSALKPGPIPPKNKRTLILPWILFRKFTFEQKYENHVLFLEKRLKSPPLDIVYAKTILFVVFNFTLEVLTEVKTPDANQMTITSYHDNNKYIKILPKLY